MNEWTLQNLALLKLLTACAFAYLYGVGGMWRKWVRRYIASLLLMSVSAYFGSWMGLLWASLVCASTHIGYGADTTGKKILKRAGVGLAMGISALPLAISSQMFGLYLAHWVLVLGANIYFGVVNPFKSARDEESVIGFCDVVLPLFML